MAHGIAIEGRGTWHGDEGGMRLWPSFRQICIARCHAATKASARMCNGRCFHSALAFLAGGQRGSVSDMRWPATQMCMSQDSSAILMAARSWATLAMQAVHN
eukprot:2711697-Rhodomonas_salina.1